MKIEGLGGGILAVGVVSLFTNALMLTGPLYMLQIYDRVLASRSEQTLLALTVLVVGLYALMAALEAIRSGMMGRIAALFESSLSEKVFNATAHLPVTLYGSKSRPDPVRDLDQCRSFLASPGPLALFDLPWLPIYLGIVYLMHPHLGLLGTAGAIILIVVMLINDRMARKPIQEANAQSAERSALAASARNHPGAVLGMGMVGSLQSVWRQQTAGMLASQTSAADRGGSFSALTKGTRLFLQSAVLGLGAYLAIQDEITPGVMIAASIITARALAPVEQTIGSWRNLVASLQARKRLKTVLDATQEPTLAVELPLPKQSVAVEKLVAGPAPSAVIVRGASFVLNSGDGLGIIGPSGSGKSSLANAMLGIWPPLSGSVRFDGSTLDQWDPARIGPAMGYLPQDVGLFTGTIAQNIARFDPEAKTGQVIKAAELAGVHELIAELPDGYGTEIGEGRMQLSAGQRQRIGLARALYGDPFFVVLDEPNANLDADGDRLLARAIQSVRERGGIIIVIAHRPSAISAVDLLMVMKNGTQEAFGPKQEVLAKTTKNAAALQSTVENRAVANEA